MFGSETLEVGIGMALLFLVVSLICSALREGIEGALKQRASDLERGIRELVGEGRDAFTAARGKGGERATQDARTALETARSALDAAPGDAAKQQAVNDARRAVALAQAADLTITRAIYAHGQIYSLYAGGEPVVDGDRGALKDRRSLPSYIPARQFAAALIDLVARGDLGGKPAVAGAGPGAISIYQLRAAVAELPNEKLRRAMTAALDHAGNDLAQAKANLEDWFDGTMDRVSGWYKRRTNLILFLLGLTAAATLNIDALTVMRRLSEDDTLRAAFLARAETAEDFVVAAQAEPPRTPDDIPTDTIVSDPTDSPATAAGLPGANPAPTDRAGGEAPAPPPPTDGAPDQPVKPTLAETQVSVNGLRAELAQLGAPIGWSSDPAPYEYLRTGGGRLKDARGYALRRPVPVADILPDGRVRDEERRDIVRISFRRPDPQTCVRRSVDGTCQAVRALSAADWLGILLGWLITGAAVTLGAPFWFDVLNKIMVIRSTVKPKEKSPEEGSEDRRPARARR